jgi:hypothetical protein
MFVSAAMVLLIAAAADTTKRPFWSMGTFVLALGCKILAAK